MTTKTKFIFLFLRHHRKQTAWFVGCCCCFCCYFVVVVVAVLSFCTNVRSSKHNPSVWCTSTIHCKSSFGLHCIVLCCMHHSPVVVYRSVYFMFRFVSFCWWDKLRTTHRSFFTFSSFNIIVKGDDDNDDDEVQQQFWSNLHWSIQASYYCRK